MILEMVDIVKNQAPGLADRIVRMDPLICGPIYQVNVFNVIHYVRDARKATSALLVQTPLIANADYVLSFVADKRKNR